MTALNRVALFFTGAVLAWAAPNLQVSAVSANGRIEVRLANVHSVAVDAYVVLARIDEAGRHQWKLKVHDSLLEPAASLAPGGGAVLGWDLEPPVDAWNLRAGVLYADGVFAGDPDLSAMLESGRARNLSAIPGIQESLRQAARDSASSDALLSAIAGWQSAAMRDSVTRGAPPAGTRISPAAFRQGSRDSAIQGAGELALYGWLRAAATAAASPDRSPLDLAEHLSARLDTLAADLRVRQGR